MISTPEGLELRYYQEEGVKHLMSGKCRLLLDSMGLGKTVQTAVAISSMKAKKAVIVCPKAVVMQWADEINRWTTRPYHIQVVTKRLQKLNDYQRQVIIIPYSLVTHPNIQNQIKRMQKLGILVLDEIHWCKNASAQRTKACLSTKEGIAGKFSRVWGLSGTLMPNTPKDLWPVMRTMNRSSLGKLTTKDKFYRRFCVFAQGDVRNPVIATKNLSELKSMLFDDGFAIMRTKEEVLSELPPKQYRTIRLDTSKDKEPTQVDPKVYEYASIGASITDEDGEEISISAIRREHGLAKVNEAVEYIETVLEEQKKVIVFAWHQDVVEMLHERLYLGGINSVTYYGALSPSRKELAKTSFLEKKDVRVFIGNIGSAGTGLDGLQKVASHAIFAELPWTYTEIAQAGDRLHRFGQEYPVTIDLTVLTHSIEEYIVKKILKKEQSFEQVLKLHNSISERK